MSYSEEVPLWYHHLKAEHVMKGARIRKAELAMFLEAPASKIANDNDNIYLKECRPLDETPKNLTGDDSDVFKDGSNGEFCHTKMRFKPKKGPTDSAIKEEKKKNKSVEEENGVHGGSSDEATDNEEEETEEQKEWLDENVGLVDVEGKDITHFNPDLWKINEIPDKHTLPFLGKVALSIL